jgi:hypothetical protein
MSIVMYLQTLCHVVCIQDRNLGSISESLRPHHGYVCVGNWKNQSRSPWSSRNGTKRVGFLRERKATSGDLMNYRISLIIAFAFK